MESASQEIQETGGRSGRRPGDTPKFPLVVATVVVYQPGEWFGETLQTLAQQDYPNLRLVFLLADPGERAAELTDQIKAAVPNAFVRQAASGDSFGRTANEVLQLVEGDNGLFLLCHDDVAPARDAVRNLVTELFRSNAGIVGPKLLDWDDPRLLQHVGLGMDRLGEIDPLIEPGEVDQEQHDAVADVFAVPSAFVLVRADLFRSLGGFDPGISFFGEDIDLCWRAHLSGARVVVVPDARVRHRERLLERQPSLNPLTLQSRHRMRAVATLTGGSRLIIRSLQMVAVTLIELVAGLFTARLPEAVASIRALVGLVPRTGSILARRRAIRSQRVVPEAEVIGLQVRGSSRMNSFLRGRETATYVGSDATVRRWRQAGYAPLLTWVVFLALLIVGSRSFIANAVPHMGEFLPFRSAGDTWRQFRDSFDNRSFGATSPAPTGLALVSLASVVTLFRMSMFQTVAVLGSVVVGAMGAWRLGSIFPFSRGRVAVLLVYCGTPLIPWALGDGRLSVLVWFAALPWLIHQLRRAAGLDTADPEDTDPKLYDGVATVGMEHRIAAILIGTLVLAVAAAFVPAATWMWFVVGLTISVATLAARGRTDVAAWMAIATVGSTVGALILNAPWVFSWTWANIAGPNAGASGRTVAEILSMDSHTVRFAVLALGLYVPAFAAVALSSAWRLTWSIRGLLLAAVFGALYIMAEFGFASSVLPAPELLAVPMIAGLALSAGALASGLETDVLAQGFGWRQPLAVLANGAMIVGVLPAVLAIGAGDWRADQLPLADLIETRFPADSPDGDYRVLYIGDPDLLPTPGRSYDTGIAFAVIDSGQLSFGDRYLTPDTDADAQVVEALDLVTSDATFRGGRALATLGIRYIVIPESRGVEGAPTEPTPLTASLITTFSNQLDVGRIEAPPTIAVFENQSFIPVAASLSGETIAASTKSGLAVISRSDLSGSTPVLPGIDHDITVGGPIETGVLHLAVPYDERLAVNVGGSQLAGRPGFGLTTAFEVPAGGDAMVVYNGGSGRTVWLVLVGALWVVAIAIATRPRLLRLKTRVPNHEGTLIDLAGETTLDDLVEFGHVESEFDYDPDSTGAIDPGLTGAIDVTGIDRDVTATGRDDHEGDDTDWDDAGRNDAETDADVTGTVAVTELERQAKSADDFFGDADPTNHFEDWGLDEEGRQ